MYKLNFTSRHSEIFYKFCNFIWTQERENMEQPNPSPCFHVCAVSCVFFIFLTEMGKGDRRDKSYSITTYRVGGKVMGFFFDFFLIIILGHSTDFNEKVIIAKILDLEVRIPNMPSVSLVHTIFISKNAFSWAYCNLQPNPDNPRGFW